MELTRENSEVIDMLRFPLIVGVVFMHAATTKVGLSAGSYVGGESGIYNSAIQTLFSQVFACCAVPLFFLFSGFLLFREHQVNISSVKKKWRSRFFTLVIPFFIWNTIDVLIQILGQVIPATKHFFTGSTFNISYLSPMMLINAYFDFRSMPQNSPLWFLRDLIALVLCSPILYFLLKRFHWYAIGFFLLLWFGLIPGINSFLIFYQGSLFFFSLGLLLSIYDTDKFEETIKKKANAEAIAGLYLISALIEVYLKQSDVSIFVLHKVNIILGMIAIFSAMHVWVLSSRFKKGLVCLAPVSYFIYLAHNSLLQAIKKLTYVIFEPKNDLSFIIIYFMSPIVTVCFLVAIYRFLQHTNPVVLRFLLGKVNQEDA